MNPHYSDGNRKRNGTLRPSMSYPPWGIGMYSRYGHGRDFVAWTHTFANVAVSDFMSCLLEKGTVEWCVATFAWKGKMGTYLSRSIKNAFRNSMRMDINSRKHGPNSRKR